MKRFLVFLLSIVPALMTLAQEEHKLTRELLEEQRRDSVAAHLIDMPIGTSPMSRIDMMPSYTVPWAFGGPGVWSLHEGLNAEVGFSVSGSFGKNRIKGAGFGEHFAAAYAMPLTKDKRWVGAFGVYADRLDWGTYRRTEAGIAGIIGYNVNDWCNLYVYGTYNFVPGQNNCGPNPFAYGRGYYGYYGCGGYGMWDPYANLKARIGAAAQFKLSEKASITLSFEHDIYDNNPLPTIPKQTSNFGGEGPGGAPQGGNGRSF